MLQVTRPNLGFTVTLDENSSSPDPVSAIWHFQHVGVCEGYTINDKVPTTAAEAIITKQLKPGHYGVLSPAYFTFHVEGVPHDTAMQWVRHQGLDHQVQSGRYTGERILDLAYSENDVKVEDLFYHQPPGTYKTKVGGIYTVTEGHVEAFYNRAYLSSIHYANVIASGMPQDVARRSLIQGFRQNHTLTGNLQAFYHAFDQRGLSDTQWEARELAIMMLELLDQKIPKINAWYKSNRFGRNRLSP